MYILDWDPRKPESLAEERREERERKRRRRGG